MSPHPLVCSHLDTSMSQWSQALLSQYMIPCHSQVLRVPRSPLHVIYTYKQRSNQHKAIEIFKKWPLNILIKGMLSNYTGIVIIGMEIE